MPLFWNWVTIDPQDLWPFGEKFRLLAENILSWNQVRRKKNDAKRSRQHAGKRYREYAQRRVCFINEQVP